MIVTIPPSGAFKMGLPKTGDTSTINIKTVGIPFIRKTFGYLITDTEPLALEVGTVLTSAKTYEFHTYSNIWISLINPHKSPMIICIEKNLHIVNFIISKITGKNENYI